MSLHVVQPGLHSLLVDLGRPACRSLGVPLGGAADRAALMLGNALVANPPEAVGLEISLAGPTLRAECEVGCVVFGAPLELAGGRQDLVAGTTFTLQAGEELHIGGTQSGMRAYLCVRGGFTAKAVLGSGSALEPVRADETLTCAASAISRRSLRHDFSWTREPNRLRVMDGAQVEWFDPDEFYRQEFTVTPASNRMGLRLQGAALTLPARDLVSEPVCPGAVQVTRDGQCIILGVDGQTIGGYPKIAQVISADLDGVGQLRPGDRVRFQSVCLDEACELHKKKRALLNEWLVRLQNSLLTAS
jgi:biotin-dependent carboxylase-like uncharacterized protein